MMGPSCAQCRAAHPQCDECCRVCLQPCNSQQICRMTGTNFVISHTADNQHKLFPLTEMGRSLAKHCHAHGDDLVFPTYQGARERAMEMDRAIENRNGRPWITFASPK